MKKITKSIVTSALVASMVLGSSVSAFAADIDETTRIDSAAAEVASDVNPGMMEDMDDVAEEVPVVTEIEDADTGDDIITETEETAEIDAPAVVYAPVQYEEKNEAVKVAAAASGWQMFDGGWYYYENGTAVTGWKKVEGVWYYFDEYTGYMYSDGIYEIGDKDYYLKKSGAMVTGWYEDVYTWEEDDGTTYSYSEWYYADSRGVLQKDWQKINGKWYYFSPYYYMYSDGIYEVDGKDYYFTKSGAIITGWYEDVYIWEYDNGTTYTYSEWYYANGSGELQDGWQKINGKWYYFEPDYYYMYETMAFMK